MMEWVFFVDVDRVIGAAILAVVIWGGAIVWAIGYWLKWWN